MGTRGLRWFKFCIQRLILFILWPSNTCVGMVFDQASLLYCTSQWRAQGLIVDRRWMASEEEGSFRRTGQVTLSRFLGNLSIEQRESGHPKFPRNFYFQG